MRDVEDALRGLVDLEPGLRPILSSHLEDNYGELLSTLFIAEVIDWVVERREDDPDAGVKVFNWMNSAYEEASQNLKDVIATGGVEALPKPGSAGSDLRDLMSPALHAVDPWDKTWAQLCSRTPPDA